MNPYALILRFSLIFAAISHCYSGCYRIPQGATGDRSPVDENYQILIDGNPSTYLPGREYNLSLSCPEGLKFLTFTLLVESENPAHNSRSELLGKFEIINPETKFSNLCENMIESSNSNMKQRITVTWIAPDDPESGCVLFKAAVLQHRTVWFIDDGYLTKKLCRENVDDIHRQLPAVDPCCACDEAKYEIVLERHWSRNTHPKDFPLQAWRTSFGTVIGASHTVDYSFWSYGSPASQGLQELAEHGSSAALEMEIKNQTDTGSIRTIIKAPGIKYKANVVGKTLATARVGPKHHMISLVTKINPSPDWILGVASMELCTANCRWIEEKVLNLYPWDVGTDSGPSYMSPDQAQKPPDVVRRITSSFPSDEHSPFYDKTGTPMKPLATLRVTRKRTYGRCFDEQLPIECDTHPWTDWSECSVKCGSGVQYRLRDYKDPEVARKKNCQEILRQTQECSGPCIDQNIGLPSMAGNSRYGSGAECELTPWSPYSECSNKCGMGTRTRTRSFVNSYASENCQSGGIPIDLIQTETCEGTYCGGNIHNSQNKGRRKEQTSYNNRPLDYDMEPNGYDLDANQEYGAGIGGFMDTSDLRTQINKPILNNNDDYGKPQYENLNTIYGSERLRGNPLNYQSEDNPQISGDLPFENTPYKQSAFNPINSRINNYHSKTTSRTTTTTTTQRNFRGNSYGHTTESTLSGYGFLPSNPYGIKTINYDSVLDQEEESDKTFCLQRPVLSTDRCNAPRVFLKNYWFYDARDMQCKLFTSDNCDRNRNKFFSMEACQAECGGQQNVDVEYGYGGGIGGGGFSHSGINRHNGKWKNTWQTSTIILYLLSTHSNKTFPHHKQSMDPQPAIAYEYHPHPTDTDFSLNNHHQLTKRYDVGVPVH
ncbi:spondin-1 [Musca vetustissima]|uniref:spondin-1 n=1 Tax=Musca vetustissima TaxID=27455 RepID=UPI002AB698E8|nr:spondin-1 [Musca vetustissima]